jgi:hypothetical protein
MIETWKEVIDHPGYEVSDAGRFRSVDRQVRTSNGQLRSYRGQLFSCSPGKRGYPIVKIYGVGTLYVHTLVLTAFVGPAPASRSDVRHLNGNPLDNRLVNLRWGTRSENVQDMIRHGRNAHLNTKRCPRDHELVAPNLVACQLRHGRRECWACALAKGAVRQARKYGRELDFYAEADRRYHILMEEVAAS